ncbi:MAG: dTMP kinase [Acidobacteria bacterium]|nr:dTMP kinase [Acidobacteriota bacterium]
MMNPPSPPKKGKFIVFEGIDGSGKDYHIDRQYKRLLKLGYDVIKTSEPWKSAEGEKARQIANGARGNLTPEEEARIYLTDRIQHTEHLIKPAMEEGKIVLCGRYYYSTMAYQGALGADPVKIREENEKQVPIPDLVLMLKISVYKAMQRIHAVREQIAIGYEKQELLEKVAAILYSIEAPYIHTVDSSGTQFETESKINPLIDEFLKK